MNGNERREKIIQILTESTEPVAGNNLATRFKVSRQVIVQDIAVLRAAGHNIMSTYIGYVLQKSQSISRVFKVHHSDEDVEEELRIFVDCGAAVEDVFVYQKVYGIIKADLKIKSRIDIDRFMEEIKSGRSSLLKNVTSEYHYHTVTAPSEKILDVIQEKLSERGFLARLQDYEPVDFWK